VAGHDEQPWPAFTAALIACLLEPAAFRDTTLRAFALDRPSDADNVRDGGADRASAPAAKRGGHPPFQILPCRHTASSGSSPSIHGRANSTASPIVATPNFRRMRLPVPLHGARSDTETRRDHRGVSAGRVQTQHLTLTRRKREKPQVGVMRHLTGWPAPTHSGTPCGHADQVDARRSTPLQPPDAQHANASPTPTCQRRSHHSAPADGPARHTRQAASHNRRSSQRSQPSKSFSRPVRRSFPGRRRFGVVPPFGRAFTCSRLASPTMPATTADAGPDHPAAPRTHRAPARRRPRPAPPSVQRQRPPHGCSQHDSHPSSR
jgi:hypothetical protein